MLEQLFLPFVRVRTTWFLLFMKFSAWKYLFSFILWETQGKRAFWRWNFKILNGNEKNAIKLITFSFLMYSNNELGFQFLTAIFLWHLKRHFDCVFLEFAATKKEETHAIQPELNPTKGHKSYLCIKLEERILISLSLY